MATLFADLILVSCVATLRSPKLLVAGLSPKAQLGQARISSTRKKLTSVV